MVLKMILSGTDSKKISEFLPDVGLQHQTGMIQDIMYSTAVDTFLFSLSFPEIRSKIPFIIYSVDLVGISIGTV